MVLYRHSLRAGLFPARFAVLLLQFQQKLFVFHSAAIAGEAAVLTDHPVAGDKNADGITVVGHSYGAACFRIADLSGNLAIAAGLPIGNG